MEDAQAVKRVISVKAPGNQVLGFELVVMYVTNGAVCRQTERQTAAQTTDRQTNT